MSPKRRVAVMTAIFAAVGVGVSVGIIAANGGFERFPDFFDPPSAEDIWVVGASIQDGTDLGYSLTAVAESSSLESAQVSMVFTEAGDRWDVEFTVANGTDPAVENTMAMSKELTREGQLADSFQPYFEPIQQSIFAVRDWEYGDSAKYLVVGAPWEQIFYKSSQVIVKVTGEETIQTPAGEFDAFVLSYKLEEKTSRVWVVQDMPLPVKAEVYDSEDQLQYRYELVRAAGV
ncbi:MAG: TapB family protein [Nitrososphaera sp.]